MAVTLDQLLFGIRSVETGGEKDPYKSVNSIGATGAYQVMKQYIAEWTKEALGRSYTQAEFLASPSAQDALARFRLGRDMKKHGWEGAAAIWFSGQPDPNSTSSDGGNTVREYVDKVKAAMAKGGAVTGGTVTPATPVGLADTLTRGLLAPLTGVAEGVVGISKSLLSVGSVATMLTRLALPQMLLRVFCGVTGAGFLLLGLVVLGREATKGGTA